MIEHTLQAWATALGMERRTLETRLVKSDIEIPAKNGTLSAKKVYAALMGDEQAEKIRNLKADADRKEREESEAAGRLFPMAELEQWLVQNYIVPMSNIMASAPTSLDTRCNPQSPEVARKALAEWVERTVKPALKANLEKPKQ